MTTREHPHLATAAPWADEPLGPARRRQVLKACLLAREPLLELHDRAREVWPGHRRTVEPSPDGTGYPQPAYSPTRRRRTPASRPPRSPPGRYTTSRRRPRRFATRASLSRTTTCQG